MFNSMFGKARIVQEVGNKTEVSRVCNVSKVNYILTVPTKKYKQWKSGGLIQNIFPELSREEREFLISGCTPGEWAELFGTFDEKDELYL